MKEYRIVMMGEQYKVQRRCFWWWSDERELDAIVGAEIPLTKLIRFNTVVEARAYITQQVPEGAKEHVVIETVVIGW